MQNTETYNTLQKPEILFPTMRLWTKSMYVRPGLFFGRGVSFLRNGRFRLCQTREKHGILQHR